MAGPIQSSEDFDYEFTPTKDEEEDFLLSPSFYVVFAIAFVVLAVVVVVFYFVWRTGSCPRSKCVKTGGNRDDQNDDDDDDTEDDVDVEAGGGGRGSGGRGRAGKPPLLTFVMTTNGWAKRNASEVDVEGGRGRGEGVEERRGRGVEGRRRGGSEGSVIGGKVNPTAADERKVLLAWDRDSILSAATAFKGKEIINNTLLMKSRQDKTEKNVKKAAKESTPPPTTTTTTKQNFITGSSPVKRPTVKTLSRTSDLRPTPPNTSCRTTSSNTTFLSTVSSASSSSSFESSGIGVVAFPSEMRKPTPRRFTTESLIMTSPETTTTSSSMTSPTGFSTASSSTISPTAPSTTSSTTASSTASSNSWSERRRRFSAQTISAKKQTCHQLADEVVLMAG